jgi:chemotaxis protein histidine kinase CheA/HAMP domain-containing protein
MQDTRVKIGLQSKLLSATLFVVISAFLAVWWLATHEAEKGLMSLSDDNQELSADNLARSIRGVLEDTRADTLTTARLDLASEAIDTRDPKNFEWYADELVRTKSKYSAIIVVDEMAEIVGANNIGRNKKTLEKPLMGKVINAPWVAQARSFEVGKALFMDPSRPGFLLGNLHDHERVLGYSVAILDVVDDRIGSVTHFISLDFIRDMLSGYLLTKDGLVSGLAVVVDHRGEVIALPSSLPMEQSWRSFTLNAASRGGNLINIEGPDGALYYGTQIPMASEGELKNWRIVNLTRKTILYKSVELLTTKLFWVFALAVVLATLVLFVVASQFLGPIRKLTQSISRTGRASEFEALPVETSDEVGALTGSFNRMLDTIQDYEKHLEQKVADRTKQLANAKKEVSDILDNMSQGIITFREDGVINNEFSAYCKELFGERPIAGETVLELFQITPEKDRATYTGMEFWLANIVGEDELQWMMTEGDPVRDVVYAREDGEELTLKLDYKPIFEDDLISKMMIVAADMTDVVKLEAEVVETKQQNVENINRAAEISAMDPELFETFIEECVQILDVCDQTTTSLAQDLTNMDGINKLFRSMHTLKGNARIFKITTVQDMAHEVEDYFQKIRDGEEKLTIEVVEEVQNKVGLVRNLLAEFEVLGRRILFGESAVDASGDSDTDPVGVFFNTANAWMNEATQELVRFEENQDAATLSKLKASVESLKNSAQATGLASLAAQLEDMLSLVNDSQVNPAGIGDHLQLFQKALSRSEAGGIAVKACAMLDDFLEESEGLLGRMDKEAQTWAAEPTQRDHINGLMRTTHSFKANARTFGIGMVQAAAHAMEDELVSARDGEEDPTAEQVEPVQKHLRLLRFLLVDCKALSGSLVETDGLSALMGEARPLAAKIKDQAVAWEKDVANRGELDALFRLVHSYKAFLRKARLGGFVRFVHILEDLLDEVRQQETPDANAAQTIVQRSTILSEYLSIYESLGRDVGKLEGSKGSGFIEECRSREGQLQPLWKGWVQNPAQPDWIHGLFRVIHSLKAFARTFGIKKLETFTHGIEDALTLLRESDAELGSSDIAHSGGDILFLVGLLQDVAVLVQNVTSEGHEVAELTTFLDEFRSILGQIEQHASEWVDHSPKTEKIDALVRSVQSAKACAQRFRFKGLAGVLHRLDDRLAALKTGTSVEPEQVPEATAALESLAPLIEAYDSLSRDLTTMDASRAEVTQFAPEALDLVTKIQNRVELLQEDPNQTQALDALFREVHSYKACAQRFSYMGLAGYLHTLEDILDAARQNPETTAALLGDLLERIGFLSQMVDVYQDVGRQLSDLNPRKTPISRFAREAEPILDEISTHAEAWLNEPEDSQSFDALFRVVHSFKACSRQFGFKGLERVVHQLEDDLDAARDNAGNRAQHAQSVQNSLGDLRELFDASRRLGKELSELAETKLAELLERLATAHSQAVTHFEKWTNEPENIDHLNALFRTVHSLKAHAREFGMERLEAKVHSLEDLLSGLRDAHTDILAAQLNDVQSVFWSTFALVEDAVPLSSAPASDGDPEQMREHFFEECRDRCTQLSEHSAAWKKDPSDAESLNALFRTIHSLKAHARTFGLDALEKGTHGLEDLLSELRDKPDTPSPEDLTHAGVHIDWVLALTTDCEALSTRVAPSDDREDILDQFVDEMSEGIVQVVDRFDVWRKNPADENALNGFFRTMHTFKAGARTFGAGALQALSHQIEDHVVRCRDEDKSPDASDFAELEAQVNSLSALVQDGTTIVHAATTSVVEIQTNVGPFADEARGLFSKIDEYSKRWEQEPDNREHLDALFRVVHSLKATARRFKFSGFEKAVHRSEDLLDAVRQAESIDAQSGEAARRRLAGLEDLLTAYTEAARQISRMETGGANIVEFTRDAKSLVAKMSGENVAWDIEDADVSIDEMRPAIVVFSHQSVPQLDSMERCLSMWTGDLSHRDALDGLFREVHSFKALAREFSFGGLVSLVHRIEDHLDEARTKNPPPDELVSRVASNVGTLRSLVGAYLEQGADLRRLRSGYTAIGEFGIEAASLIGRLESDGEAWLDEPGEKDNFDVLYRTVHSLKACARRFGLSGLSTFVHLVEDRLDSIRDGASVEEAGEDILRGMLRLPGEVVQLALMVASEFAKIDDEERDEVVSELERRHADAQLQVQRWLDEPETPEHLNALFRAIHSYKAETRAQGILSVQVILHELEDVLTKIRSANEMASFEDLALIQGQFAQISGVAESYSQLAKRSEDDLDPEEQDEALAELLGKFSTEAKGAISSVQKSMMQWRRTPAEKDMLHALLRSLHSFKANARTFGVRTLQARIHQTEDRLVRFREGDKEPNDAALTELETEIAIMLAMVEDTAALNSPMTVEEGQDEPDLTKAVFGGDSTLTSPDDGQRDTCLGGFGLQVANYITKIDQAESAWSNKREDRQVVDALLDSIRSYGSHVEAFGLKGLTDYLGIIENQVEHELPESSTAPQERPGTEHCLASVRHLRSAYEDMARELTVLVGGSGKLGDFVREAAGFVGRMQSARLKWQEEPTNADALNDLFRVVHSFKASCRNHGLSGIENQAHRLEDLFDTLRESETLDNTTVEPVSFSLDALADAVGFVSALAYDVSSIDAEEINLIVDELNRRYQEVQTSMGAWFDEPGKEALLHAVLRHVHSLKAEASSHHLLSLQKRIHALEDLLVFLRDMPKDDERQDALNVVKLAFAGIDAVMTDIDRFVDQEQQDDSEPQERLTEMLEDFVEECESRGRAFKAALEDWRREPGEPDHINKLFRDIHSLKANARSFGLNVLQSTAHVVEDRLMNLRASTAEVPVLELERTAIAVDGLVALVTDMLTLGRLALQAQGDVGDLWNEDGGSEMSLTPGDKEGINAVFRVVHTFKALAQRHKFGGLTAFIHNIEDGLERLRDNPAPSAVLFEEVKADLLGLGGIVELYEQIATQLQGLDTTRCAAVYFVKEAQVLIERMERDVTAWVKEPDKIEHLDALFRSIHSYKGTTRSFGFRGLESLVHHMEDELDGLRAGGSNIPEGARRAQIQVAELRRLLEAYLSQATDVGKLAAGQTAVGEFAREAATLLGTISSLAMQWVESESSDDILNSLFRVVHSFKACARRFSMTGIESAVHGIEDRLDALRQGASADKDVREGIQGRLLALSDMVNLHVSVAGDLGAGQLVAPNLASGGDLPVERISSRHSVGTAFALESRSHLETIGEALSHWAEDPAHEKHLNAIFRAVHSLKAQSKEYHFLGMASRLHLVEDRLSEIRNKHVMGPDDVKLAVVEITYIRELVGLYVEQSEELGRLELQALEIGQFVREASSIVLRMNDASEEWLEEFDKSSALDRLFREVHSLKACARRFAMGGVEAWVHGLEDELDGIRDGKAVDEASKRQLFERLRALGDTISLHLTTAGDFSHLDPDELADGLCELEQQALNMQERWTKWSQKPSQTEEFNALFRVVHSFKAQCRSSAIVGLQNALHRLEDRLSDMREKGEQFTLADVQALEPFYGPIISTGLDLKGILNGSGDKENGELADLCEQYRDECNQRAQQLTQTMQAWQESNDDSSHVNALFRTMHSLKANARTFGIHTMEALTHGIEDRLVTLRDEGRSLNQSDVDDLESRLSPLFALVTDAQTMAATVESEWEGNQDLSLDWLSHTDRPKPATKTSFGALGDFGVRCGDLVDRIDEALRAWLSNSDDTSRFDALFREVHSLKAHGGEFEYSGLVSWVHDIEDKLDEARSQQPLTTERVQDIEQSLSGLPGLLGLYVKQAGDLSKLSSGNAQVNEFAKESGILLGRLQDAISAWTSEPEGTGLLDGVFRVVHSFKACCGRFNLAGLETWVHGLEDRLDALRQGEALDASGREALCAALLSLGDGVQLHQRVSGELSRLDEDDVEDVTEDLGGRFTPVVAKVDEWQASPENMDHLNGVFRVIHSLKAESRRHGLSSLESSLHGLEDHLSTLRDRQEAPGSSDMSEFARQYVPLRATFTDLGLLSERSDDEPDLDEVIEPFVDESRERTDALKKSLKSWSEDVANVEHVNALFRTMHSLKANARAFGVHTIEALAHDIEDRLVSLRDRESALGASDLAIVSRELGHLFALVDDSARLNGAFEFESEPISQGEESSSNDTLTMRMVAHGPRPEQSLGFVNELARRHHATRENLLSWSEEPTSRDAVNALFRVVHTYKAETRQAGIESLEQRIHALEDRLAEICAKSSEPTHQDVAFIRNDFEILDTTIADLTRLLPIGNMEEAREEAEEILGQFLEECKDRLSDLIKVHQAWSADIQNKEHIHSLFRTVHSLKANARTFGVETLERFAHRLEDRLVELRERPTDIVEQDLWEVGEELGRIRALAEDTIILSRPVDEGGDREEALEEFVEECRDRNNQLREVHDRWKVDLRSTEHIDKLFRTIHSYKANARSFGVGSLEKIAHSIEDELEAMRVDAKSPSINKIALIGTQLGLLKAVSQDSTILSKPTKKETSGLKETIEEFVTDCQSRSKEVRETLTAWSKEPVTLDFVSRLFRLIHSLKADARNSGMGSIQQLSHRVEDALSALREQSGPITSHQVAETTGSIEYLLALVADIGRLVIFPEEDSEADKKGKGKGKRKSKRKGKVAKVPQAKIMELRKGYKELSRALEAMEAPPDEFLAQFQEMGKVVQALTQVPLADLFERFTKMVFDLGAELGKRFDDLKVSGEDIYVDTKLIEKMRDVLIHALRNCCDHGIEPPEERPSHKPEKGVIGVNAYWDEQDLVVEVFDDGRGVNFDAVREKAYSKGFLTDETVDDASPEDLVELLFRPGFSMAKKVTDVSGRGVGMDVIRSTMRELKGEAGLITEPGVSTTLSLRIPADYYQSL